MPGLALVGLSTAGGGKLYASPNTNVTVNGYPVAVIGTKVASHGTAAHAASVCTQGSSTVTIGGVGVVRIGDLTSCAHPVVDGAPEVVVP